MNINVGDYLMTTGDIYCANLDKNIKPFTILKIRDYYNCDDTYEYNYDDTYEVIFKNK